MNILESQAKAFFRQYNIPVLESQTADTPQAARKAAQKIGGSLWALKAQILAGGRGLAGGVKLVKTPEQAEREAAGLLGKSLVTAQTGEKGELVRTVLVEAACQIKKEYYLSLLIDPETACPVFIASPEGGTDIEEAGARHPEKIFRQKIHPLFGFQPHHAWSISRFLGLSSKEDVRRLSLLCQNLYRLFSEKDAGLLEINPLVQDESRGFIALDGKMSFDENALFRHEDLRNILASQERAESEAMALEHGLSFIQLEGRIGCMVNGAGLAMATMDIIKLCGGSPANFLDVGGGAEEEKVTRAFEIILRSREVKAILVNIFGGIMQCDVIAAGLIGAVKKTGLKIPVVIRLEGTRSKEGLELLKKSGLNLTPARTLDEAAQKAVQAAGGAG